MFQAQKFEIYLVWYHGRRQWGSGGTVPPLWIIVHSTNISWYIDVCLKLLFFGLFSVAWKQWRSWGTQGKE